MRIENVNGVQILVPESPEYILYNAKRNEYCEKVCLGKNDSMDNYTDMNRALLEKTNENKKVQDLLDVIEKQNTAIADLAAQLAELSSLVNKK